MNKNDITGKYCWSTNQEEYYGNCDTIEDAKGEAIDSLESDWYKKGEEAKYYISTCKHPLDFIRNNRCIYNLLENINEYIYEEVGGEDEAVTLTKEQIEELRENVISFLYNNGKVNRWGVDDDNTQTFTHIIVGEN